MRLALASSLLAALALAPGPALARTCRVDTRAGVIDVPLLSRLAARGELALVENEPDGRARQVVLFSVLDAPPERVWDVLMDVARYPAFIRTVVRAEVTRREGDMVAFEWALDLPFFDLEGTRVQRGKRPALIEVRGERGHLAGSRERWELYPVEGGRTLAAFYRALDMDTAGLVLGAAVKLEPSMEQAANLSTAFVHLAGLKRHLAGLPPLKPGARSGPVPRFASLPIGQGELAPARLAPLLAHGQLAVVESGPDGALRQAAIFGTVEAPTGKLVEVVRAPERYPEFLRNFAEQRVTREPDGRLRLDWELEVPLTNLEGTSMMTLEDGGAVDVLAVDGDITRGRWRWEFVPLGPARTLPVHYAYSDVRESSWVTRKILEKEPLFEHGMVIASGTVALTGMKARAEGRR